MNVSVIIAARNAAETIEAALGSVAAQTYPPLEIILVDDGSDDGTSEKAKETGIPIVLVRVECRNAAASRNLGIGRARGEWIAFLDADDEWHSRHLENAANAVETSDSVAYLAAADYVDRTGRQFSLPRQSPPNISEERLDSEAFVSWFGEQSWFCNCTAVLRKSRVDAVGGFDESLPRRHDLDLFLRVIHGGAWAYSSTAGARIGLGTPGSISEHRVSCEMHFLKSFTRLLPLYDSPRYRMLVHQRACTAVNTALQGGTRADLKEAWALASPHIKQPKKALYHLARCLPDIARWALRLRHKQV